MTQAPDRNEIGVDFIRICEQLLGWLAVAGGPLDSDVCRWRELPNKLLQRRLNPQPSDDTFASGVLARFTVALDVNQAEY